MPGQSGGVALNAIPSDATYEALGDTDADADADGLYAAPTAERPQTVYAPDFLGGGVPGEQALYDAAGDGGYAGIAGIAGYAGYAYADAETVGATEAFPGFSGAVRVSGGYSEPRPITRLPSSRPAAPFSQPPRTTTPPVVPGRPSLRTSDRAPPGAAAAPGWVTAVLALYGLLFCVAFGLLGAQGPTERTVYETTQEVIHAFQTVGAPGFVGQVGFFATTSVPSGWIICDGRAVAAADFPDLAAALGADANATAFRVPDMVSGGGLFPRGGLTPGVVQEQSVAVDDLAATVEVWDYANPSAVVPWWNSPQNVRDPDAPRRQTVSQFWYDRTGTRQTDVGLWSYTFPVNFTAGGGNETRPPAIVLVPAIYGGGP